MVPEPARPPATVVADDDLATAAAVPRVWTPTPGPSLPQPLLFGCERHLRERAKQALEADNAHAGRGRWMRRLDTAFRRPEGWEEFHDAAQALGGSAVWVNQLDDQLRTQTAVRHLLPAHYSTAGAEPPLTGCGTCTSSGPSRCATPPARTCLRHPQGPGHRLVTAS